MDQGKKDYFYRRAAQVAGQIRAELNVADVSALCKDRPEVVGFAVDPKNAKRIEDVVSLHEVGDGTSLVGITITDPSLLEGFEGLYDIVGENLRMAMDKSVAQEEMSFLKGQIRAGVTIYIEADKNDEPVDITNPELTACVASERYDYVEAAKGIETSPESKLARIFKILTKAAEKQFNWPPQEYTHSDIEAKEKDIPLSSDLMIKSAMELFNNAIARYARENKVDILHSYFPKNFKEPIYKTTAEYSPKYDDIDYCPASKPGRDFPSFVNLSNVVAKLSGKPPKFPRETLRKMATVLNKEKKDENRREKKKEELNEGKNGKPKEKKELTDNGLMVDVEAVMAELREEVQPDKEFIKSYNRLRIYEMHKQNITSNYASDEYYNLLKEKLESGVATRMDLYPIIGASPDINNAHALNMKDKVQNYLRKNPAMAVDIVENISNDLPEEFQSFKRNTRYDYINGEMKKSTFYALVMDETRFIGPIHHEESLKGYSADEAAAVNFIEMLSFGGIKTLPLTSDYGKGLSYHNLKQVFSSEELIDKKQDIYEMASKANSKNYGKVLHKIAEKYGWEITEIREKNIVDEERFEIKIIGRGFEEKGIRIMSDLEISRDPEKSAYSMTLNLLKEVCGPEKGKYTTSFPQDNLPKNIVDEGDDKWIEAELQNAQKKWQNKVEKENSRPRKREIPLEVTAHDENETWSIIKKASAQNKVEKEAEKSGIGWAADIIFGKGAGQKNKDEPYIG